MAPICVRNVIKCGNWCVSQSMYWFYPEIIIVYAVGGTTRQRAEKNARMLDGDQRTGMYVIASGIGREMCTG